MKFLFLDKEYKVTSETLGEVKTPANTFEIPQIETLEEAIQFVGGEQGVVDAVNDVIRSDAKNGALAVIRNAAKDSVLADVIAKAANYAKTFVWSSERGTSKKALLEGVAQIQAARDQFENMTKEQIMELLNSTLLK